MNKEDDSDYDDEIDEPIIDGNALEDSQGDIHGSKGDKFYEDLKEDDDEGQQLISEEEKKENEKQRLLEEDRMLNNREPKRHMDPQ